MNLDADFHHRNSIRLREYDYRAAGAYFVTVCAHEKAEVFGDVVDGEVVLSAVGEVVEKEWLRSAEIRKELRLDAYVIMPNHFHAIVWFMGHDDAVGATRWVAHKPPPLPPSGAETRATHRVAPTGLMARSLGSFIGQFKSICTKLINEIRSTPAIPVWQRNYYERIIRNEKELNAIREYIINNPVQWQDDEENPNRHP